MKINELYLESSNDYKFLRPNELRGSYTNNDLLRLGFKLSKNKVWYIPKYKWEQLLKTKQIQETKLLENTTDSKYINESSEEEQLLSVEIAKKNIHKILLAAQKQYDRWDESDIDTYAGGGICHLIAEDICSVLFQLGIECTTQSCTFEQHVYVIAKFIEGIYQIDIPYHVYETGGGFSWKKLPDIKFHPNNVVFYRITSDTDEWDNYVELYEGASGYIPSEKEKNDPRFKTALTVDVKPDSIKQNAKKLGLGNIHRSGVPPLLRNNKKY